MQMDFPHRKPISSELPKNIMDSLSIKPNKVLKARDYVLVYEDEEQIKNIEINKELFDQINLDPGVLLSPQGVVNQILFQDILFLNVLFFEDPVTGSTHCSLVPYWSGVLKKPNLKAFNCLRESGEMFCEDLGNRVIINGKAKTYFKGKVTL